MAAALRPLLTKAVIPGASPVHACVRGGEEGTPLGPSTCRRSARAWAPHVVLAPGIVPTSVGGQQIERWPESSPMPPFSPPPTPTPGTLAIGCGDVLCQRLEGKEEVLPERTARMMVTGFVCVTPLSYWINRGASQLVPGKSARAPRTVRRWSAEHAYVSTLTHPSPRALADASCCCRPLVRGSNQEVGDQRHGDGVLHRGQLWRE